MLDTLIFLVFCILMPNNSKLIYFQCCTLWITQTNHECAYTSDVPRLQVAAPVVSCKVTDWPLLKKSHSTVIEKEPVPILQHYLVLQGCLHKWFFQNMSYDMVFYKIIGQKSLCKVGFNLLCCKVVFILLCCKVVFILLCCKLVFIVLCCKKTVIALTLGMHRENASFSSAESLAYYWDETTNPTDCPNPSSKCHTNYRLCHTWPGRLASIDNEQ